jgi:glycosyltransferase involved in cell wall biosynthesis
MPPTPPSPTFSGTEEHVDAIGQGGVLDALRAATVLRRRPGASQQELRVLLELADRGDVLARATAAYALSRRPEEDVDRVLLGLLQAEEPTLREAAALAFSQRPFHSRAVPALCEELARGGFGGMLAELALEEWARGQPALARPALVRGVRRFAGDLRARRRLAAVLDAASAPLPRSPAPAPAGRRLRIAQVFLQGRIDGALRDAGAGDAGGLATLVVHLSRALGRRPELGRAVTITRAFAEEGSEGTHDRRHEPIGPGAAIERVRFGPEGYLPTAAMWLHRLEVEGELERRLAALGPLDVVHLRFADVGTFAAARACRRLGIPVCFTLAADPHAVVRQAERAGLLDRDGFATADARDHYLFRTHLVETMLAAADGLVTFPRADAEAELRELLALDAPDARALGLRPVAEGISLSTIDRAAGGTRSAPEADSPAVRDLRAAIRALPPDRHGLPLILSVGRFHRVKGFHRLAEAWAGDAALFSAFNLVLVGGDMRRPTPEERTVIGTLRSVEARHPHARDGLILLGHRAHDEVAQLLHAARRGVPGAVAPHAVYACASDKEEFGLALLEALAVGLAVVAPDGGGPETYVDDGITGRLVDTTSVEELRLGLHGTAALRHDETRAAAAASLVRSRFSVDAMAAQLASLYGELAEARRLEAVAA